MKTVLNYFKQIITSAIIFFGIMVILFFLWHNIPSFSFYNGVYPDDLLFSICASAVFSLIHFVITSDCLDGKVSMKLRVIICGIPTVIICCILTREFGLQTLVHYMGIQDKKAAGMLFDSFYVITVAAYVLIYFFIELRLKKKGKAYDAALKEYKEKNRPN